MSIRDIRDIIQVFNIFSFLKQPGNGEYSVTVGGWEFSSPNRKLALKRALRIIQEESRLIRNELRSQFDEKDLREPLSYSRRHFDMPKF